MAVDGVVVVVDDNAASCNEIVEWLCANDIAARAASDSGVMRLIEDVKARIVICRPGSTGIALFHALQEATDPPMVVLLSDAPAAKDEIYSNGRMLVAVIRTPVQMPSLARFVKSVAGITSRLDPAALATLMAPADETPATPDAQATAPLRLIH
jgi:hypothetical protein